MHGTEEAEVGSTIEPKRGKAADDGRSTPAELFAVASSAAGPPWPPDRFVGDRLATSEAIVTAASKRAGVASRNLANPKKCRISENTAEYILPRSPLGPFLIATTLLWHSKRV